MKIHIVQKGDTLWTIAKKYGVNFEDLKKMNAQLSNPDLIMPGMKITVPGKPGGAKKETAKNAVPVKEQKMEVPAAKNEHPFSNQKPSVFPVIEEESPSMESSPPAQAPAFTMPPVPQMIPEFEMNQYFQLNMDQVQKTVQPAPPKEKEKVKPIAKEKPMPKKEQPKMPEKPANLFPGLTEKEKAKEEPMQMESSVAPPPPPPPPQAPPAMPKVIYIPIQQGGCTQEMNPYMYMSPMHHQPCGCGPKMPMHHHPCGCGSQMPYQHWQMPMGMPQHMMQGMPQQQMPMGMPQHMMQGMPQQQMPMGMPQQQMPMGMPQHMMPGVAGAQMMESPESYNMPMMDGQDMMPEDQMVQGAMMPQGMMPQGFSQQDQCVPVTPIMPGAGFGWMPGQMMPQQQMPGMGFGMESPDDDQVMGSYFPQAGFGDQQQVMGQQMMQQPMPQQVMGQQMMPQQMMQQPMPQQVMGQQMMPQQMMPQHMMNPYQMGPMPGCQGYGWQRFDGEDEE